MTPPNTAVAELSLNGGPMAMPDGPPTRYLFAEPEKEAVVELFDRALAEGSHVLGYGGEPEREYCEAFSKLMGGGFTDAVNSGSSALYAALAATDPPPMSEVVVPPVTDAGGVMPVTMLNALPVAADAMPGSYHTDASQIEKVITDKTHAIIVTHIAGIPIDMDPILELAKARGIWVVEDCAQAHYAFYKGRPLGSLGHIAAFSTMFGKQHATGGQGGLVYTRDETLHLKARRAADRGKPFGIPGSMNVLASLNLNMDHMHAAIGRVQVDRLPVMIAARREVADRLAKESRRRLKAFRFYEERPDDQASWWFVLFTMDADRLSVDRAKVVEALQAEGVQAQPGYPFMPVQWPWATERCVACGAGSACDRSACAFDRFTPPPLPNAAAADASFVRMEIHEGWTLDHADRVIDAMAKVESAYGR